MHLDRSFRLPPLRLRAVVASLALASKAALGNYYSYVVPESASCPEPIMCTACPELWAVVDHPCLVPPLPVKEVVQIIVSTDIDANGRAINCKIEKSTHPDLNAEALRVTARWTFRKLSPRARSFPTQVVYLSINPKKGGA